MQFITSPKKIIGLDISDLSLKAVQIEKRKGLNYIRAMNSINLPTGLIEEGLIKNIEKVADNIKKLVKKSINKFTTKYAVVCLPETKTFIKVIEVPSKEAEKNKARDIIMRELPRHIPINTEDVQIDWQEIGNGRKTRKFLVGAAPKITVDDYIQVCEMAGLEVTALEVEAQAITRSILPMGRTAGHPSNLLNRLKQRENKNESGVVKNTKPKIILDLGATRTGLILTDHNIIQFANSLAQISGEKITARIMEQKKLSYSEAEKAKIICGSNPKKCKGVILEIVRNGIDDLIKEIINADNFYQEHFGQETHDLEILLSGGGANLSNIDEILREKLKRDVKIANPLANTCDELPGKIKNLMSYTTAIGLSLRNYI